jgi:hypothetical protein
MKTIREIVATMEETKAMLASAEPPTKLFVIMACALEEEDWTTIWDALQQMAARKTEKSS